MYWIKDVSLGRRIGAGGEATVYKAIHDNCDVVVREFHPPPQNDWSEADGRKLLKVSDPTLLLHKSVANNTHDRLALH